MSKKAKEYSCDKNVHYSRFFCLELFCLCFDVVMELDICIARASVLADIQLVTRGHVKHPGGVPNGLSVLTSPMDDSLQ